MSIRKKYVKVRDAATILGVAPNLSGPGVLPGSCGVPVPGERVSVVQAGGPGEVPPADRDDGYARPRSRRSDAGDSMKTIFETCVPRDEVLNWRAARSSSLPPHSPRSCEDRRPDLRRPRYLLRQHVSHGRTEGAVVRGPGPRFGQTPGRRSGHPPGNELRRRQDPQPDRAYHTATGEVDPKTGRRVRDAGPAA